MIRSLSLRSRAAIASNCALADAVVERAERDARDLVLREPVERELLAREPLARVDLARELDPPDVDRFVWLLPEELRPEDVLLERDVDLEPPLLACGMSSSED